LCVSVLNHHVGDGQGQTAGLPLEDLLRASSISLEELGDRGRVAMSTGHIPTHLGMGHGPARPPVNRAVLQGQRAAAGGESRAGRLLLARAAWQPAALGLGELPGRAPSRACPSPTTAACWGWDILHPMASAQMVLAGSPVGTPQRISASMGSLSKEIAERGGGGRYPLP